jgi:hypothetical protein
MRRSLLALVALFLTLSIQAAEFSSVNGTVEVKKTGTAAWKLARPGGPVVSGDAVRTGPGSRAEVKMDEGHRVALREKTSLRVESAKKGASLFFLEAGKLKATVNKLRGGSRFEVKTPLAVAAVRGTVFEMSVADDQTSRLDVLEGRVSYRELVGAGREVLVPQGQTQVFSPPAAPPSPAEPSSPEKGEPSKDKNKDQKDRKDEKPSETPSRNPKEEEKKKVPAPDRGKVTPTDKEGELRLAALDKSLSFREEIKQDLKLEILRETDLAAVRETQQDDVIQTLRQNQYEEGKVLLDAFGRQVRMEEYLTRSADGLRVSQTFMSRREGRDDMSRYDIHAAFPLPKDLSGVNLFFSKDAKLENWAVATEHIVTRGDHYFREWKSGGKPVSESREGFSQSVLFDHWFVEAKGAGEPMLLSHWVPDLEGINGSAADAFGVFNARTGTYDGGDGALDIPVGYQNFMDINGSSGLGNDRPIEKVVGEKRLFYFDSKEISSLYDQSEGYSRDAVAFLDEKQVDLTGSKSPLDDFRAWRDGSLKRSVVSTYTSDKGETMAVVHHDEYYVTDEGRVLPFGKVGPSLAGFTGVNREEVYRTSLGKLDIDVLIGPSTLRPVGRLSTEE